MSFKDISSLARELLVQGLDRGGPASAPSPSATKRRAATADDAYVPPSPRRAVRPAAVAATANRGLALNRSIEASLSQPQRPTTHAGVGASVFASLSPASPDTRAALDNHARSLASLEANLASDLQLLDAALPHAGHGAVALVEALRPGKAPAPAPAAGMGPREESLAALALELQRTAAVLIDSSIGAAAAGVPQKPAATVPRSSAPAPAPAPAPAAPAPATTAARRGSGSEAAPQHAGPIAGEPARPVASRADSRRSSVGSVGSAGGGGDAPTSRSRAASAAAETEAGGRSTSRRRSSSSSMRDTAAALAASTAGEGGQRSRSRRGSVEDEAAAGKPSSRPGSRGGSRRSSVEQPPPQAPPASAAAPSSLVASITDSLMTGLLKRPVAGSGGGEAPAPAAPQEMPAPGLQTPRPAPPPASASASDVDGIPVARVVLPPPSAGGSTVTASPATSVAPPEQQKAVEGRSSAGAPPLPRSRRGSADAGSIPGATAGRGALPARAKERLAESASKLAAVLRSAAPPSTYAAEEPELPPEAPPSLEAVAAAGTSAGSRVLDTAIARWKLHQAALARGKREGNTPTQPAQRPASPGATGVAPGGSAVLSPPTPPVRYPPQPVNARGGSGAGAAGTAPQQSSTATAHSNSSARRLWGAPAATSPGEGSGVRLVAFAAGAQQPRSGATPAPGFIGAITSPVSPITAEGGDEEGEDLLDGAGTERSLTFSPWSVSNASRSPRRASPGAQHADEAEEEGAVNEDAVDELPPACPPAWSAFVDAYLESRPPRRVAKTCLQGRVLARWAALALRRRRERAAAALIEASRAPVLARQSLRAWFNLAVVAAVRRRKLTSRAFAAWRAYHASKGSGRATLALADAYRSRCVLGAFLDAWRSVTLTRAPSRAIAAAADSQFARCRSAAAIRTWRTWALARAVHKRKMVLAAELRDSRLVAVVFAKWRRTARRLAVDAKARHRNYTEAVRLVWEVLVAHWRARHHKRQQRRLADSLYVTRTASRVVGAWAAQAAAARAERGADAFHRGRLLRASFLAWHERAARTAVLDSRSVRLVRSQARSALIKCLAEWYTWAATRRRAAALAARRDARLAATALQDWRSAAERAKDLRARGDVISALVAVNAQRRAVRAVGATARRWLALCAAAEVACLERELALVQRVWTAWKLHSKRVQVWEAGLRVRRLRAAFDGLHAAVGVAKRRRAAKAMAATHRRGALLAQVWDGWTTYVSSRRSAREMQAVLSSFTALKAVKRCVRAWQAGAAASRATRERLDAIDDYANMRVVTRAWAAMFDVYTRRRAIAARRASIGKKPAPPPPGGGGAGGPGPSRSRRGSVDSTCSVRSTGSAPGGGEGSTGGAAGPAAPRGRRLSSASVVDPEEDRLAAPVEAPPLPPPAQLEQTAAAPAPAPAATSVVTDAPEKVLLSTPVRERVLALAPRLSPKALTHLLQAAILMQEQQAQEAVAGKTAAAASAPPQAAEAFTAASAPTAPVPAPAAAVAPAAAPAPPPRAPAPAPPAPPPQPAAPSPGLARSVSKAAAAAAPGAKATLLRTRGVSGKALLDAALGEAASAAPPATPSPAKPRAASTRAAAAAAAKVTPARAAPQPTKAGGAVAPAAAAPAAKAPAAPPPAASKTPARPPAVPTPAKAAPRPAPALAVAAAATPAPAATASVQPLTARLRGAATTPGTLQRSLPPELGSPASPAELQPVYAEGSPLAHGWDSGALDRSLAGSSTFMTGSHPSGSSPTTRSAASLRLEDLLQEADRLEAWASVLADAPAPGSPSSLRLARSSSSEAEMASSSRLVRGPAVAHAGGRFHGRHDDDQGINDGFGDDGYYDDDGFDLSGEVPRDDTASPGLDGYDGYYYESGGDGGMQGTVRLAGDYAGAYTTTRYAARRLSAIPDVEVEEDSPSSRADRASPDTGRLRASPVPLFVGPGGAMPDLATLAGWFH